MMTLKPLTAALVAAGALAGGTAAAFNLPQWLQAGRPGTNRHRTNGRPRRNGHDAAGARD